MLSSKLDRGPSAETQESDVLTTGRTPVVTSEQKPLATSRMPVVASEVGPFPTTGRMPVVIPGTGKKLAQRPVKTKHRVLLHASVVLVLGAFILTALLAVLPLGKDGQALGLGGLLKDFGMNMVNSNAKNSALVGPQAATATAIMQNDGYDPGAQVSQAYNASLGINSGSNNFPYGQCTWWADQRYHDLTGYYIQWSGNAYQWAYNASAYPGWVVSGVPHVPSIVVFQPGVQYASPLYGHVGVLEGVNPDGSLHTSNMNVSGYAFGARVDLTNYAGPGVSFVYHV
jgi:surface antigen